MESYSILAVDSEVRNLNALKRTFGREHDFFSAANVEDALAIMEHNRIDTIIAGDRISDMTGIEFLKKTMHMYPDVVRIALIAYVDEKSLTDAISMGYIHRYISIPWEPKEIKAIVREENEMH